MVVRGFLITCGIKNTLNTAQIEIYNKPQITRKLHKIKYYNNSEKTEMLNLTETFKTEKA